MVRPLSATTALAEAVGKGWLEQAAGATAPVGGEPRTTRMPSMLWNGLWR
jgi:hypothetical protein